MSRLTRAFAPALAAAVLGGAALVPGAGPAAAALVPTPDTQARPTTDEFQLATFNVLGGSHRAARSGPARINGAIRYLRKHDVAVVGFQELERKQYAAFRRQTNDTWGVVGTPTRNGKRFDPRNAIAFEKSRFELVSASHLAIPYFHGARVNIPVATLRSRTTGATYTMLNTHNASDVHGRAQRWRNEATQREVKLVAKLRSQGRTVFVTGDMNERARYFCAMTRSGAMHSASGGSVGRPCRAPKRSGVDWIFGSRDVGFSQYVVDASTRSSGVSDHPILVSKVTHSG